MKRQWTSLVQRLKYEGDRDPEVLSGIWGYLVNYTITAGWLTHYRDQTALARRKYLCPASSEKA